MHDVIRDKDSDRPELRIYDYTEAKSLFVSGEYTHRQLSIMKQVNIKNAAESGQYKLGDLKYAVIMTCGYCFKYECDKCPLHRCYTYPSFDTMGNADTLTEFIAAHREWCWDIGFKKVYGGK